MRLDHSIKNVFLLPGVVIAISFYPHSTSLHIGSIVSGLVAVTLIACSNYVLNEILDAPFDRLHPLKCSRPAARRLVAVPFAYAQWLLLMGAGMMLALHVNTRFALAAAGLWIMGCIYNVRPLRTKDIAYLDVLTESINNPLRMLLGWYMVTQVVTPPASLVCAYWALGCYLMSLKRFSELREIGSRSQATAYRRSFGRYTEHALLGSAVFYASVTMMMFAVFSAHYRMALFLSFPLFALLMAMYFNLSLREGSAVQHPEKLYRERLLMMTALTTAILMAVLLNVNLATLGHLFRLDP